MNIKKEYELIQKNNNWCTFYQNIKEASEAEAKKLNYTLDASKKQQNKRFNRYRDVNPYDHSRIVLKRNNIDYINANLVKLEKAKRSYILCQGPLEYTVSHFWLMIWEQNSKAILMLNKIIEKKQIKCHPYWPSSGKLDLNDVGLTVEFVQSENYKNFSKRLFKVTDTESLKSREVIQFHYTEWPDFGVPETPFAFLQFLKQVRDSGVLDENVGPAVVHCSAGIGRSGTFCLVDCCLVLFENDENSNLSVQDILLELRKSRMGLIQTHDQLSFSYEAIIEGIRRLENNTFDELNHLEICVKESDDEENAPPIPPRFSSNNAIQRPLPTSPLTSKNTESSSDSSESTSSDASSIPEDPSDSDNDLDIDETNFNANAKLPAIPNGTKDLSPDEDRANITSDASNDLRHRNRTVRNEAMKEKIREIKRKTQEAENWPKKRRSQTPQDK